MTSDEEIIQRAVEKALVKQKKCTKIIATTLANNEELPIPSNEVWELWAACISGGTLLDLEFLPEGHHDDGGGYAIIYDNIIPSEWHPLTTMAGSAFVIGWAPRGGGGYDADVIQPGWSLDCTNSNGIRVFGVGHLVNSGDPLMVLYRKRLDEI